MSIPSYNGSNIFNTNTVPSNLSGDWTGYVSCGTGSS